MQRLFDDEARRQISARLPALLFLFACLLVLRGMVVRNVTRSEPLGYYLLLPAWNVRYGEIVAVCEPPRAYAFEAAHGAAAVSSNLPIAGCPQKRLLIKNIWGLPGDRMRVSQRGVLRNGVLIAQSAPVGRLAGGEAVPTAPPGLVPAGTIWGGSPVRLSFDSRYFGAAPLLDRAILLPGWVVEGVILGAVLITLLIIRVKTKDNPPS